MALNQVTLDDKYELTKSRVFVTGFQTIVRLCLMQVGHCLVQIGLRGSFPGKKVLGALGIQFCELQRSLSAGEIALGLSDRCLKKRWINLRDYLASFHL